MIQPDPASLSEDIVAAVMAGDIHRLQELGKNSNQTRSEIGRQTTGCGKNVLHHAVLSRNLSMVRFVFENYHPPLNAEDGQGLTPLTLACTKRCPIEIITYLVERSGLLQNFELLESSLEFAVRHSWYELAGALIKLEASLDSETSCEPLRIVVQETGDAKMLQLLLETYSDTAVKLVTQNVDDLPALDALATVHSYELDKKIACFKILFKLEHPEAYTTEPERYNVKDILNYAYSSHETTPPGYSLIPYFIATERKWEKREPVLSLYERLLPEHELLALIVLYQCGSPESDREILDEIFSDFDFVGMADQVHSALEIMFKSALNNDDNDRAAEALQLLEDFATFGKSITMSDLLCSIKEAASEQLSYREFPIEYVYQPSFHRVVKALLTLCVGSVDDICNYVFEAFHVNLECLTAMFSALRHCATLAVSPEQLELLTTDEEVDLGRLIIYMFCPWKEIQQHVGQPILQLFTLKRFARDVVRESILQAVKGRKGKAPMFFDHLQSLNVPEEVKEYLRYCDYTSTVNFVQFVEVFMKVSESMCNE